MAAKKDKPNAIMHRPNSSWFSNAIKSIGLTSADIIKDLMPYTSGSVESITSVAKDVRSNIRKGMSSGKTVTGQIEKSNLIQLGRTALKNAANDLKTGNLYNKDRSSNSFGGDFNFDDSDLSFGDDDEWSDDSGNTVVNNVNTIDSGAMLAVRDSVNKQTNATIAGATATVNTMVAVSSNMMMANQKSMSEVLGKLTSIDSNLASMLTYMNENVTKFIEASIAHYGEVSPKKEESSSSSSDDKASSATIFGDNGFNASEYLKHVKQNFNDSTAGGMIGMVKDLLPMMVDGYVTNPIGEITKAVGKHLMGKEFKESLRTLDKTVQSFIPTMLERLADKADDYSDNGPKGMLMRFIGDTFGVRTKVGSKFARRKFENGVTPFDNETKLAITEVIPSYLRDILSAVTGQEKQVFDKNEMKFRNESTVENEIYGTMFNSAVSAFHRSAVGNKLTDRKERLDGIDKDKFEELMNRFYVGLSRSSGEIDTRTMSSDHDLMKYLAGNDESKFRKMKSEYGPILQYFVEALNSTSVADRAGLNYSKIQARQSMDRQKREIEASPELYNLNVTNNGKTINQGIDAYLDRAYGGGATVVGQSAGGAKKNNKYGFTALMDTIYDIKAVLFRGINVRSVRTLDALPGESSGSRDDDAEPISQQPQYGSSVAAANQSIEEDRQLDEELRGNDGGNTSGHRPTKAVNRVTEILNAMVAGGPNAASNLISDTIKQSFEKAGSWIDEHILDPMSKTIFGSKDESTGKNTGIFGGIKDSFTDMINGAIHGLTGKGYTKLNPGKGEDAEVADSEDSLAHKAGEIFSNIKNGVAEYLFGKKNEETGKREGGGFIGKAKETLSAGLSGWSELLFGKPEEGEDALDKAKEWAKDAIPSGIGGGAAGFLTSSLMSGSILGNIISPGLGGLIGAGIGMVSKSEKFQTWLFGKKDDNGERIGGIISKKTREFLGSAKNSAIGGAAVGLFKSIIFPTAAGSTGAGLLTSFVGGPIAGMLMGAGVGLMRKSQWYQELMYGKDDENGNHINGIKDKIKNFFSKNGSKDKKAGGGYKAGMTLVSGLAGAGTGLLWGPTGAIIGGLMGTATGILSSSEKFKTMLFGKEDENGKRVGGALGKLGMWMDVNVMKPIQYGANYLGIKLQSSAKRMLFNFGAMLDPLKIRIGQIKDEIVYKVHDIGQGIKAGFARFVFKPLKGAMNVALKPIKFIGKQAAKLGVTMLKAPIDALGSVFKGITKMLVPKNVRGVMKAAMRDAKDALKQTFARTLKGIGNTILTPFKGVMAKFKDSQTGEKIFRYVVDPMKDALAHGARKVMDFIGKSVKAVLGFPFKLLGHALALPFKALGFGAKTIAKVGRLGVGALSLITNARKDGEDASQGARSRFLADMREKAQSGQYGFFGMIREGARWLDPASVALDKARNDPNTPLNDKVEVTDEKGRKKTKSYGDALEDQNKNLKKEEEEKINELRETFDLRGMRRRAKHYGYDPRNKDQILGVQQVEIGLRQATRLQNINDKLENIHKAFDENQKAILGSVEKNTDATQEGQDAIQDALEDVSESTVNNAEIAPVENANESNTNETSEFENAIRELADAGTRPGSIYVNDIHSGGILGSIYRLLAKYLTGTEVSDDELEKISNPHLNPGAGEAAFKKIAADADKNLNVITEPAGADDANNAIDESAAAENAGDSVNAEIATNNAADELADGSSAGDSVNAEIAENAKAAEEDAEADKQRNEEHNAEVALGVEKSKNYVKDFREKAEDEEKSEEEKKPFGEFMKNMWSATKAHTKSWFETFDLKKGAITAGILALIPVLLPALKSLLSGQLVSDIVGGIGQVVSNTFSNFGSEGGIAGVATNVGDLGRRAGQFATFNPGWMTNANGTTDNVTSSVSRFVSKKALKAADKAVGAAWKITGNGRKRPTAAKIMWKGTKTAAKTVASGAKAVKSSIKAGGGIIKIIKDIFGKFVKWLGEKFAKHGGKVGAKIAQKMTGEVMEKVAVKGGVKIAAAAGAKTVTAAISFGVSELVWAALGAVDGLVKAAQMFEVREADVDASMRAISATFCALLGTTAGTVIDIIASVAESIIGTNFIREAAQLVWSLGRSDEEKQYYQNCKDAFKDDWKQSAYDKYMELETEGAKMSKEQFLSQSDENIANLSGLSKNDYNAETNKDILGHVGSFFSGLFGGNKTTKKAATSSNAELITTNWAGGVVKGNGPRLSMLSPGEIVINPADPDTMKEQKRREEAARDKIYSRIYSNAEASELGVMDPRDAANNTSPEYGVLKRIATILTAMYSKLFGVNAFSHTSNDSFKNDYTDGESISATLTNALNPILDKMSENANSSKVAVKDVKTGGIRYMTAGDAAASVESGKYEYVNKTASVTSGAGRGSDDGSQTKDVGNAKLYQQEDPSWNDPKYRGFDMYDSGCGPTAAAIAASAYGSNMNPISAASIIDRSGYRADDGGTLPQGISQAGSAYGIDMHEGATSPSAIVNNLKRGRPVIFMGQDGINGRGSESVYGNGMHYVVGTGIDSKTGDVEILDPLKRNPEKHSLRSFLKNTVSTIYTGAKSRMRPKSKTKYAGRGGVVLPSFGTPEYYAMLDEISRAETNNTGAFKSIIDKYSTGGDTYTGGSAAIPMFGTPEYDALMAKIKMEKLTSAVLEEYDPGTLGAEEAQAPEMPAIEYEGDILPYADKYSGASEKEIHSKVKEAFPSVIYDSDYDTWKKNFLSDHPSTVLNEADLRQKYFDLYGIEITDAYDDFENYKRQNVAVPSDIYETSTDDWLQKYVKSGVYDLDCVNDILRIMRTEMGLKESTAVVSTLTIRSEYFSTPEMVNFIFCAFNETDATYLVNNLYMDEFRPYLMPMIDYKVDMDIRVNRMVAEIDNDKITTYIQNNIKTIVMCASKFDSMSTDSVTVRSEIFAGFIPGGNSYNKKIVTYMAKQYPRLMKHGNSKFSQFVRTIMGDKTCSMESPVDIRNVSYLAGKTIKCIGTAAQCDLVRVALTMLKKLSYSYEKRNDISSGYADSVTAIAYLYNSIGLPIPDTASKMYVSGKGTLMDAESAKLAIDTMTSDNSEDTLLAGDILLYRYPGDSNTTAVRHVEMYAGDGIMLGHSGGKSGSVKGFHASKVATSIGDLELCGIKRFIKIDGVEIHEVEFDVDNQSFTIDGEEESSDCNTSIIDVITGFFAEVATRLWNGLLTGNFDSDFSSYFGNTSGAVSDGTTPEYAANDKDISVDSYLRTNWNNYNATSVVTNPHTGEKRSARTVQVAWLDPDTQIASKRNVAEYETGLFQDTDTGDYLNDFDLIRSNEVADGDLDAFIKWQNGMIEQGRTSVAGIPLMDIDSWYQGYRDDAGGRGRKKTKGKYGRGNKYTANGQTVRLPKGLGWYRHNEPWSAITGASKQLDLKNQVYKDQNGSLYDDDGYAKIGNRFVVATTETYGDPGDFIDIEQSNGTKVEAIIGDIKAWGVSGLEGSHVNKWGHNDGDAVLEFIRNGDSPAMGTNPSEPGDPHYDEWKGSTVTSITNRGNYLTDGKTPLSSTGTLSDMSYSVTKHSGTPGANTLSPLAEGYEEWRIANGVKEGYTSTDGTSVYGNRENTDATYRNAQSLTGGTYTGSTSQSSYSNAGSTSTDTTSTNSGTSENILSTTMDNINQAALSLLYGDTSAIRSTLSSAGSLTSTNTEGTTTVSNRGIPIPQSLLNANEEYGAEVAASNASITSNDRDALYDPVQYNSTDRADGWFLSNMPYSYKSSSFGEDYVYSNGTHLWSPCHKGIDIAAGTGTKIYTPVDGTIASVTTSNTGFGNHIVIIDKDKNYRHIFAHQNAFADGVYQGKQVKRGDLIGYVGSTGYSTGPHLHYQVNASSDGGSYVNPNAFPYSIYDRSSAADDDTMEALDTNKDNLPKGSNYASVLNRKTRNSKISAVRSEGSRSSNHSMPKGGGSGEVNTLSTSKLETLTETMIDILNTISDNTLSTSQKLDNIKTSAVNMKRGVTSGNASGTSSTPTLQNNAPSASPTMSTNETFARKIARGY